MGGRWEESDELVSKLLSGCEVTEKEISALGLLRVTAKGFVWVADDSKVTIKINW
jgi:hypothetical protein